MEAIGLQMMFELVGVVLVPAMGILALYWGREGLRSLMESFNDGEASEHFRRARDAMRSLRKR